MKHQPWLDQLIDTFNRKGIEILELRSKAVTSVLHARNSFNKFNSRGFDYHPVNIVSVVGDVHKLIKYFDKKFDLIFSVSYFEHFAIPWVAATEINKQLKVNSHIFTKTHIANRFNETHCNLLYLINSEPKILFSSAIGYKCLDTNYEQFNCRKTLYLCRRIFKIYTNKKALLPQ